MFFFYFRTGAGITFTATLKLSTEYVSMQRHCNKKRQKDQVLTMDACKTKGDADDCVSKMNHKILNWLLCMRSLMFWCVCVCSFFAQLNCCWHFSSFGPVLYHSSKNIFLNFMQQQINIVGLIINAFVS